MSPKSVDLDELVRMHSADECPTNHQGRYLMVPAASTTNKAEPHTRVTTFAKSIDDSHGLSAWQTRMVVAGFAKRPDLFARFQACRDDDKHGKDKLCDEAKEAAAASAGANLGSACHAFCERVDLGEKLLIPPPFDADVGAYRTKLDELEIRIAQEWVERYVVLPGYGLGGRLDRIVHFGSTPKILDIKTGNVDYAWGAIAVQLACYAHAETFYNPRTRTHEPFPTVDQDVALVAHIPVGAGRCDIYFVDIAAGWETANVCANVRTWRSRAKRGEIAEEWRSEGIVTNPDVRRARLAERVVALRDAGFGPQLIAAWPEGVAFFKAVHEGKALPHSATELDLIAMTVSVVENRHQMAFGPADPADR